ncbi:DUF998 domain-containing protein [Tropicimonas sediminicola]|uniref:Uncharacterized protein n=1 Tax=Tropicimonas sediminicola TaxID=1031541 RepID=A0A239LFU4_9RHOB|nr:DUF998 domain-containing protein [Tropicimonas sediminicola]SNT28788.1 hypothetical protein SAMN05421757_109182 [Tropicimonas sediminicola]
MALRDGPSARHIAPSRGLAWIGLCILAAVLLLSAIPGSSLGWSGVRLVAFLGAGLVLAGTFRSTALAGILLVGIIVCVEVLALLAPGETAARAWDRVLWSAAGTLTALALTILWQRSPGRGALAAVAIVSAGAFAWLLETLPGSALTPLSGKSGTLHYTVNHAKDFPAAFRIGFNLADVSSAAALDGLPEGAKGVLWTRNGYNSTCTWQRDDASLVELVHQVKGHPKFSGIYFISDVPRPSTCPDAPQRIAERTALIHKEDPNGRTFIAISGGYYYQEEFAQLAQSADLIGVVVYPCNTKIGGCDMAKIDERVGRALDAGIPKERLVPVLQAFGQACTIDQKNFYLAPTKQQLAEILARWDVLLPPETRPFDMTYSWGMQENQSCPSLAMLDGSDYPDLQSSFRTYFARMNR